MHGTLASTARRATSAKTENIYGLAQRLYDDANKDSGAAVAAIIAAIRRRPALAEEAFKIAAEALVGNLTRADREKVLRGEGTGRIFIEDTPSISPLLAAAKERSKPSPERIKAQAEQAARFGQTLEGLYTTRFRVAGQLIVLGLATPEQLRPVAAHYLGQGATMVRRGRWLEKIIASAKAGTPIHKSLSLKDIERMQKDSLNTAV